jgi:hypothetical protein
MKWMRAFTQSPDGKLFMPHSDLSDEVQKVNDTIGVMQSATAALNAVQGKIEAAKEAALELGATEAELQPVTDVINALDAAKGDLATAVANQPA